MAAVALLAAAAVAQDVHVQPRSKPEEKPLPSSDATLKTHTKPFFSNVDVVLVPVTVTDPLARIVTGLDKTNFRLLDNDRQQDIEFFYTQDAPISVGIVFDNSGSMSRAINISREAVKEFMKTSNPDDEFFMITFAEKPKLTNDFSDAPEKIEGNLVYTMPRGQTALWDAVYLGLSKMRTAKYSRKALLVISDGGENDSRYSAKELRRMVVESDVQIYGVGIPGADYDVTGMQAISSYSGGRMYEGPPSTFADTAEKIAIELRNQYVVGYRPKDLARDGKFHKIKIRLDPPRGLPSLTAVAMKSGYYAPEQ